MKLSTKAACVLFLCAAAAACSDDSNEGAAGMGGSECLAPLDLECTPAYPPTFEQIYTRRIEPTCGVAPCHAESSKAGNLVLADPDQAYDALVGERAGGTLVIDGDPECSVLIQRIESTDLNFVMPARNRLSPTERCAIRQWVANGAER